jgi:hypothetical protein
VNLSEHRCRSCRVVTPARDQVPFDGRSEDVCGLGSPPRALEAERPKIQVVTAKVLIPCVRSEEVCRRGPCLGVRLVPCFVERRVHRGPRRLEEREPRVVNGEPVAEPDVVPERARHAAEPKRTPRQADRALKRRLGDVDVRPEGVQQLLLRHDAPGMADKVAEQVEDTWLEIDRVSPDRHLARLFVQLEVSEPVDPVRHPSRFQAYLTRDYIISPLPPNPEVCRVRIMVHGRGHVRSPHLSDSRRPAADCPQHAASTFRSRRAS